MIKKIYISQVDTVLANGNYPIEFLFFCKNKLKSNRIRCTLKKLSAPFWPMFGEYRAGIIQSKKYSESEVFDEVSLNQTFDSNESAEAIYDRFNTSIPADLNKLFFLKIIQHNNGTVIIPKQNHLAGDGYSYFYFLSLLAKLSRPSYLPFKKQLMLPLYKPHHKRNFLKEFKFDEIDLQPVPVQERLALKFEEVSREEVREMMEEATVNLNNRVSSNDILSALITKKLVPWQKEQFGEEFQLTIPIDVRRHIREYGAKFFGNGLMFHTINFKMKEMEQSSINELAIKIRQSMPLICKESYIKFLDYLEDIIAKQQITRLRPFDPGCGILITNLSKLPVNKLNFGSGKADLLFPLTIAKNSTAILADKDNYILRFAY